MMLDGVTYAVLRTCPSAGSTADQRCSVIGWAAPALSARRVGGSADQRAHPWGLLGLCHTLGLYCLQDDEVCSGMFQYVLVVGSVIPLL